ncbi:hypothetical protein P9139_00475 [Curtobacterium flaccumfaciens]|nr:hypothetical protein P9139_00475 [Curtobacterium flaccumfaciens]
MTNTIRGGSAVTITATGEHGVVVAPHIAGSFTFMQAGSDRLNIPVYSVLLASGEVRQYVGAALELEA